ncbi:hypothetical protein [Kribbella catacumbae]|uniref:hypothetical protein n=1 Tax=Kribbella catacumbae TaxID=460086 RepID=UPI001ED999B8|nr:hypothetical protein [Kribbella catacumbae]
MHRLRVVRLPLLRPQLPTLLVLRLLRLAVARLTLARLPVTRLALVRLPVTGLLALVRLAVARLLALLRPAVARLLALTLLRLSARLVTLRARVGLLRLAVARLLAVGSLRALPWMTGLAALALGPRLLALRSGVRVVLGLAALRWAAVRALWSTSGTRVVPTSWRIGVVGHMPPRVAGGLTTGPKQANAPAAMTLTRQIPIRLQRDPHARSWPR